MTNGGASSETISRGIWRGEADVGSSCEQHGNVYVDSKWKVAQAFSIIGCLYGSGLFCCGLSKDRSEVHPMLWVCVFCSGIMLLMLSSSACSVDSMENEECKLGMGGIYAIVSSSLFVVASCLNACLNKIQDLT
jgi:sugar phosphate permease